MMGQSWVGEPASLLTWHSAPEGDALVMVSPFAEEHARCRRLQTRTAQIMAETKRLLIWLDLPATGDSPLEESAITLPLWFQALHESVAWIEQKGIRIKGIGGLRLGASLVFHWAQAHSCPYTLVLVEPASGLAALKTVLRTRAFQSLEFGFHESAEQLKQRLEAGENLEAAGYPLSANTAACLTALSAPTTTEAKIITLNGRAVWLDNGLQSIEAAAQSLSQSLMTAFQ